LSSYGGKPEPLTAQALAHWGWGCAPNVHYGNYGSLPRRQQLDTNICIALIRQQTTALVQRITSHAPGDVGVSSITLAELAHGVEKSARAEQNRSALEQFLLPLELADFDQKAAFACGTIRAQLEGDDQTIGSMDLLIAAHAISLETTLVTNNVREFQRVTRLNVEDWTSESG
jgi:tRNA(fMet)-specific endonuclease VapC